MTPLFFIISGAIVAVGAGLYIHDRLTRPHRQDDSQPAAPENTQQEESGEECCGMHITCERDSLLAAVSEAPEYFDDEELDRFAGKAADSYTDEEIEEFRDVLLTLLPDDIAPWARSIQLRGIELPDPVREELLMIVAEARRDRGTTSHQS